MEWDYEIVFTLFGHTLCKKKNRFAFIGQKRWAIYKKSNLMLKPVFEFWVIK